MKKVLIISFIAIFIFSCNTNTKKDTFDIAIISIVEIDPIVQLRKGFKEVMDSSEFAKQHKIKYSEYNAQNDASIQNQIIDKVLIDKPNLVYALGTPIAQAVQKRMPDVLLVQGTATDPVSAGLANSWEGSGKNYIATTDLPPIDKQIELIRQLTPNLKRLGVIYNPGEINSVAVIERLKKYISSNSIDIVLVERAISTTSDVATAINSLIGKADAIYLPPDNTAHAAIPVIGRVANENKLPFYATVESAIDEGALATLSLDFVQMGRETAYLTLEVLNGKDPKTMPIKASENPTITLNAKVAKSLSIDLSSYEKIPNYIIKK